MCACAALRPCRQNVVATIIGIFAKLSFTSSFSWAELALFILSFPDELQNIADGLHKKNSAKLNLGQL